jgi:alpha-beta hydrolase superfamily lysophospholipase
MSEEAALAILDQSPLWELIFYPREDLFPPRSTPNIVNYLIEVEDGIRIGCRFYKSSPEHPSLLYFHGNGETAGDHDGIAPLYNERGINLFVADYRGYGLSDGTPTFASMINDAHVIFKVFGKIMEREGWRKALFLMGRSLGSMPAIELAFHYADDINGLITESGWGNNFRRLWRYLQPSEIEAISDEKIAFLSKLKMRSIRTPTLIIHGEHDTLVPVQEAQELYQNSAAEDKTILMIPNADHNTLIALGQEQYFQTIETFIKAHC